MVDEHLRTSDPDIFAAGDVANAYHPLLRPAPARRALGQRAAPARGRRPDHARPGRPYDRLPYFFTDQYDLGMEYTGYADPDATDDVVVRGDLAAASSSRSGCATAGSPPAMNVNMWDVTEPIRELIRSGQPIDETRLADPAIPLGQLVAAQN